MKIINREQIELNAEDRRVLTQVRRKKTLFIIAAYFALIGLLTIIYLISFLKSADITIEKAQRFKLAIRLLAGISFLLFTCLFIIHYYKTIYPYTRDLKKGLKTISWFYPVSYKTPFFDNFFLKTGSRKRPMLSIPKYVYDAIQPGTLAFITFAPTCRFVLLLDINGFQVAYNEENSDLEL
jgi:hypothetical protein